MITSLLNKGRSLLNKEHEDQEEGKLNTLRGGNSGIYTPDGEVYGACPRLSHLRSVGHQLPNDTYTDQLFAAGYANEDIVAEELRAAGIEHLREEAIPVKWTTSNGTDVSGRPDIVLTEGGKPVRGLELKLISSIWTARSVMAKGEPKSDHLIQAAHYSWQLDIPWTLLYSNRAYWHIPIPPSGAHYYLAKDFVDNRDKVEGNGWCEFKGEFAFRVVPAYIAYDLKWEGESFYYSAEGKEEWVKTAITKQAIESYYEAVAQLGVEDVIGPRPSKQHVNGGKDYNKCDYCALKPTCDEYESYGMSRWKDAAILEINNLKEK